MNRRDLVEKVEKKCLSTDVENGEHVKRVNNKEKVLKNTYELNELLHKMDIKEDLRSQFVGIILLYIKNLVSTLEFNGDDGEILNTLKSNWKIMSPETIRVAIKNALEDLLDGSQNKQNKIDFLQKNIFNNQKVKNLTSENWIKLLETVFNNIYKYIDADSSEGQDILNLFFIAFNKYIGKADRNQAFTPDHITEFMCCLTEVDRTKVVLDATCGSGSFLVQAMVKELSECRNWKDKDEAKKNDGNR